MRLILKIVLKTQTHKSSLNSITFHLISDVESKGKKLFSQHVKRFHVISKQSKTHPIDEPSFLVVAVASTEHRSDGLVETGALVDRGGHAVELYVTAQRRDLGAQADPHDEGQADQGPAYRALRVRPRHEHAQGEQAQRHAADHAVERQGDL